LGYLQNEFEKRSRANSNYSLRAFSRSLGINSSTLSALFSKKRPLTAAMCQKLLDRIEFEDQEQKKTLLMSVFSSNDSPDRKYTFLSEDGLQGISSWEPFAILSLLQLKGFCGNARSIGARLNLNFGAASAALRRLEKRGLIEFKNKSYVLKVKDTCTSTDVPSSTLKKVHRQYIEKAIASLGDTPIHERDITGVTLAISAKKLQGAKRKISEFRRNLVKYLEVDSCDRVYRLNIQLFPLDQAINKNRRGK